MKRLISYLLILALPALLLACSKGNEVASSGSDDQTEQGNTNNFSLNRDEIIGCWQVIQAKYSEDAKMTDWEFEDTYAEFKDNGLYEGKGYFGNGQGTFSVEGNVITTKIDNVPFIVYEVTAIEDDKAELTATLQSNKQKIWMVCQKVDDYLEENPGTVISEDTYFNNENDVAVMINAVYASFASFMIHKNALEEDIVSGNLQVLTPTSSAIKNLWAEAYVVLRRATTITDGLRKISRFPEYSAHAQFIRAIVGYHLATLWGSVPYYTTVPDEAASGGWIPRVMANGDILESAYKELTEGVVSDFEKPFVRQSIAKENYLNGDVISVIASEILLSLSRNADAEKGLQSLATLNASAELYLAIFDSNNNRYPVYSKQTIDYLYKESKNEVADLVTLWTANNLRFGYWQMLKRIGKAKEISGCEDYQLLLPIPQDELNYNPNLTQNPGY